MAKKKTAEQGTLFSAEGQEGQEQLKQLKLVDLGKAPKAGRKMQGWTQSDAMSHDQMWRLTLKNPYASAILSYMIARMQREATGFVASAQTLPTAMDISLRSVQNAISLLRQYNFVQVLKTGNTNVYVINSQVAWRGERGMRQAVFNATINLVEREQDQTVEELEKEAEQLLPVPDMSMFSPLINVIDMPEGQEPRVVPEDGKPAP